jgi:quercetin dioxygenase-like cupin family protein
MMTAMKKATVITAIGIVGALAAGLYAQPAAFKRTVLQQADISAPGREVVTAMVEFQPGGSPGRHTHPGEEVGYVVDGTILLEQDGKPATTLKAGQAFLIPAGTVHNATNNYSGITKLVANYIVEKGKPLATPAPAK